MDLEKFFIETYYNYDLDVNIFEKNMHYFAIRLLRDSALDKPTPGINIINKLYIIYENGSYLSEFDILCRNKCYNFLFDDSRDPPIWTTE